MQSAGSSTITLRVCVRTVTLEILWLFVDLFLVRIILISLDDKSSFSGTKCSALCFEFCLVQAVEEPKQPVHPCVPSPCGPYSICRVQNDHAVCSCRPEYIGVPPSCRPECVASTECTQDRACINQRCTDPCPGTCAYQARCQTVNHNPICSCPPGYTGDPFVRCVKEESKHRTGKLILYFLRPQFAPLRCIFLDLSPNESHIV